MNSRRAELRVDLLELAEGFPLGSQAAVFCQLLAEIADGLAIAPDELLAWIRNAIESQTLMYEDRMAWKRPSEAKTLRLLYLVSERLSIYSPFPTYDTFVIMRDCVVQIAKRGAPPGLIYAILKHLMTGAPFIVEAEDDPKSGNDLNGIPAWIKG